MALIAVGAYYSTGSQLTRFLDGNVITPSGREALVMGVDMPTADNTGVLPGSSLTAYTTPMTITGATTIENRIISSRLTINTSAPVVIRNCLFNAGGFDVVGSMIKCWDPDTIDVTIVDCTFEPTWPAHTNVTHTSPPANAINGHGFTLLRCKFIGVSDICQRYASVGVSDVVIQQCYANEFCLWRPNSTQPEGNHQDGVQIMGGTSTQVLGNAIYGFISQTIGDGAALTNTGGYTSTHGVEAANWNTGDANKKWMHNSCVFMKPDSGNISGVVIDKNWFFGGSVQIHASDVGGSPQTDLVITGNRFGNPGTVDAGKGNKPSEFGNAATTRSNATVSGNTYMNGSDADADI